MQGTVSGLSSVNSDEERHGLIADWGFAFCGEFRDQGGRIRGLAHLLSQVLWLVGFFWVAEGNLKIFYFPGGEKTFANYRGLFFPAKRQKIHFPFFFLGEVKVDAL